MLNQNFTTFLIALPEACKTFSDNTITFSLPIQDQECPQCHQMTSQVHDYRNQKIKTATANECGHNIVYRRRRYRCPICGKVFAECNTFIGKNQQIPYADVMKIIDAHKEVVPTTMIARRFGISATTVHRMFRLVSPSIGKLDEAISLDEFHGNAGAKFQVVLNSLTKRKCLNLFSDRTREVLYHEISLAYPLKERLKVKHVSIDLSPFFKRLAEDFFPNAQISADKFHAVRLANEALDDERKAIQSKLPSEQRKYFKRSRYLLLKREKDLNTDEYEALQVILNFSDRLSAAYAMKEQYFKIFDSKNSLEFSKRLLMFRMAVEKQNIPAFNKLLRTTIRWKVELIHGISTGYNNGFTEGCNTTIKTLKRVSYGYKNFKLFKRRIMFVLNDEARRLHRLKCHAIPIMTA